MAPPTRSLEEKLWEKVKVRDFYRCWEIRESSRTSRGYGNVSHGRGPGSQIGSHRLAWQLTHGPIPEGLWVRHKCDNPPCCNPLHLELGTQFQNAHDRKTRRPGGYGGGRKPMNEIPEVPYE